MAIYWAYFNSKIMIVSQAVDGPKFKPCDIFRCILYVSRTLDHDRDPLILIQNSPGEIIGSKLFGGVMSHLRFWSTFLARESKQSQNKKASQKRKKIPIEKLGKLHISSFYNYRKWAKKVSNKVTKKNSTVVWIFVHFFQIA